MSDSLILTLVTGEAVSLEVEDGRAELERFLSGDHEYTREWIRIDDGRLVRREAIVSARIGGDPADRADEIDCVLETPSQSR